MLSGINIGKRVRATDGLPKGEEGVVIGRRGEDTPTRDAVPIWEVRFDAFRSTPMFIRETSLVVLSDLFCLGDKVRVRVVNPFCAEPEYRVVRERLRRRDVGFISGSQLGYFRWEVTFDDGESMMFADDELEGASDARA